MGRTALRMARLLFNLALVPAALCCRLGNLAVSAPHHATRPDTLIIRYPPSEYAMLDVAMEMRVTKGWGGGEWSISVAGSGQVHIWGWQLQRYDTDTTSIALTDSASINNNHDARVRKDHAQLRCVDKRHSFDFTTNVPVDSVISLLSDFYAYDFFAMRPRYGESLMMVPARQRTILQLSSMRACDLDQMTMCLRVGSFEKCVVDNGFAPIELHALAQRLHSISQAGIVFADKPLSWNTPSRERDRFKWDSSNKAIRKSP